MSGLGIRIISALIAGIALLGIGYWGGAQALAWVAAIVVFVGVLEYSKMAFARIAAPRLLYAWFYTCAALVLGGVFFFFQSGLLVLSFISAIFFTGGLWLTRNRYPNVRLLTALAMGSLGLVYFVSFPAMAIKTLFLNHGVIWFVLLLIVVFAGDTFAYFGGRLFGRTPLMPEISPKKTLEGSFSGLFGSALGGYLLLAAFLPQVPWYWVIGFALGCGIIAQAGDLFVSLVKRVADVKDSGKIMPGHGGILDRLDGIYIAAPIVYGFARLCEATLIF